MRIIYLLSKPASNLLNGSAKQGADIWPKRRIKQVFLN